MHSGQEGTATNAGAEVIGAKHYAVVVEADAGSEATSFLANCLEGKKNNAATEKQAYADTHLNTPRYYTFSGAQTRYASAGAPWPK